MARPPKANRAKVTTTVFAIRITEHERELLEQMVRNHQALLDRMGGGSITAAGLVRGWIREAAKEAGIKQKATP